MLKRLTFACLAILILSGCSSSKSLTAQDKRNNFDLCKIEFLKQISESESKLHSEFYGKQADEGCAPLLSADAKNLADFNIPKPKSYNSADGNKTLTINVTHGPWDISSDQPTNSTEANRLCKDENFNYPLGERIEVLNENSTIIGTGKISTFVSATYKSENTTDYILTCNFSGTVELKGVTNFYRIKIAGTFWNDLTPIDSLLKSNWILNLNSDDY